jgi:hypothetical protein
VTVSCLPRCNCGHPAQRHTRPGPYGANLMFCRVKGCECLDLRNAGNPMVAA